MATCVVLLGPPGAGKGTQALRLAKTLNIPHISSGDLFREHLKNKTELGETARGYIDRGELVPDDVTIGMIQDRLARPDCVEGALLDGFPRTIPQSKALDEILGHAESSVCAVLYIEVADDILVRRLSGRRTCRQNGHIFHADYNPPMEAGICDIDGSELYQRSDDMPETVLRRIMVYKRDTAPLIESYREKGLVQEIDGERPIEEVTQTLMVKIKEALGK